MRGELASGSSVAVATALWGWQHRCEGSIIAEAASLRRQSSGIVLAASLW